jgi:hypothetical protein
MKIQTKPTQLALLVLSVLALNACIEVDDDSNDQVVVALQEQNQILSEQLTESQRDNTVTFSGVVVDTLTGEAISNTQITAKTASGTVLDGQMTQAGQFSIPGLPANSSVEIFVASGDDSYLGRVFYRNTGDSTSGVAEKDLGTLELSRSQDVNITVSDSLTNMPVEGLQFIANSNSGSGASENDFRHLSTFDPATGSYQITLPVDFNLDVVASIDANRDGERDFEVEDLNFARGTQLVVRTARLDDLATIFVRPVASIELDEIELRLSIVDAAANVLSGAMVSVNDANNDVTVGFDATANQYILTASVDGSIRLQIPAFSVDDVTYQSATIIIIERSETQFDVSISNSSANNFYTVERADSVELVLQPRLMTAPNTQLEVLLVNDPALNADNSLSVFYSQPISVNATASSLVDLDALNVVRGNDSSTDLVLPGTTLISSSAPVEVTHALSLNDTKLTVTPNTPLDGNTEYSYSVANVRALSSGIDSDFFEENNVRFTTEIAVSNTPFDINSLRLDNDNYTSAGVAITPQNTAGVASNPFDSNSSVRMFLPEDINQLRTLTLNQVRIVSDGVPNTNFRAFNVVQNGQPLNTSKVYTVASARNENVDRSNLTRSVRFGTSLEDGLQKEYSTSFAFLSDNTSSNENSITFEYAYETKAGDVVTGTVTLPVL